MRSATLALALFSVGCTGEDTEAVVETPIAPSSIPGALFYEPFTSHYESRWEVSTDEEFTGEWRWEGYKEPEAIPGDKGLVVGSQARRHAISTRFATPIVPKDSGLVVQYELQLKNVLNCGGAYLKLLTASEALAADGFRAETPYTLMFGPDKCGGTHKVHFILRHKSPKTGLWEEKHLVTPPVPPVADGSTHMYTAIVGVDNSVRILIDGEERKTASLLSKEDFSPPVNPPEEIDDPTDSKPADWVEDQMMDDPSATKPSEWDEDAPSMIPDPEAVKPEGWLDDEPLMVADASAETPSDWDADEDGEWEAPIVSNPKCLNAPGCGEWSRPVVVNPAYKGKWAPPKIENPAYKGEWKARQIKNPDYFYDETPYAMAPIGGIGIELWTMQDGILFDNILISADEGAATALSEATFKRRQAAESASKASASSSVDGIFSRLSSFIAPYMTLLFLWISTHVRETALALTAAILSTLWLCCFRSKKKAVEDGEDEDDKDEPRVQELPPAAETKKAAAVRKRTPKAE